VCLLDYRGELGATLNKVKALANKEYAQQKKKMAGEAPRSLVSWSDIVARNTAAAAAAASSSSSSYCCQNCVVQASVVPGGVSQDGNSGKVLHAAADSPVHVVGAVATSAEAQAEAETEADLHFPLCGMCGVAESVLGGSAEGADARDSSSGGVTRNGTSRGKVHDAVDDAVDDAGEGVIEEKAENEEEEDETEEGAGAYLACKNFRELLWYWGEYYLRRGRDRLSIEFGAHIAFRYWYSVVGKIAGGNGGWRLFVCYYSFLLGI
jgi:hypothetical protein